MLPQAKSGIKTSNYFTDIIRNNFKQIQEAYFGTKTIEEREGELQIKESYVGRMKFLGNAGRP